MLIHTQRLRLFTCEEKHLAAIVREPRSLGEILKVTIPEHYFYYRVENEALVEIRPDPVPGGAPRGIFEQIGVTLPPLQPALLIAAVTWVSADV